jgi:hypothetical protein
MSNYHGVPVCNKYLKTQAPILSPPDMSFHLIGGREKLTVSQPAKRRNIFYISGLLIFKETLTASHWGLSSTTKKIEVYMDYGLTWPLP